jgi:hypothetical protein
LKNSYALSANILLRPPAKHAITYFMKIKPSLSDVM